MTSIPNGKNSRLTDLGHAVSLLYFQTIAEKACCTFQCTSNPLLDKLKIDGTLKKVRYINNKPRDTSFYPIDIQLKHSSSIKYQDLDETTDDIKYEIGEEIFETKKESVLPFYLVLVMLPVRLKELGEEEIIKKWIEHDLEKIVVHAKAYYYKLEYKNKAKIVTIPKENRLDENSVINLFSTIA